MDHRYLLSLLNVPAVFIVVTFCVVHQWFDYYSTYFHSTPEPAYDFIVVGGGSAGAVVAARLAENPSFTVALLEAGGHAPVVSYTPVMVASLALPTTGLDWGYRTEPQSYACKALTEHRSVWTRGKVLGGSSVLNYMIYIRGNKHDYDHWAELGNNGWSYDEVLPYFIKSEDNTGSFKDEDYHGKGGLLTVEDRVWKSNLPKAFLDAGRELGYDSVDVNGKNQTGFATPQVTMRDGERWSTARAFLYSAPNRPNLKIITHAMVEKVLFDEQKRAIGVQFNRWGSSYVLHARKEVVLSAGTIGSAQILMLSGIGPKEHLQEHNIPVVADLKVGYNLQDHIAVPVSPLIHNDTSASLVKPSDIGALIQYALYNSGPYSTNGIDGVSFLPSSLSSNPDWPDIQIHFMSFGYSSDSGSILQRLVGIKESVWNDFFSKQLYLDIATIFATLVRPKSRGRLRLKSADPRDHPSIDPLYFSHPDDMKIVTEATRFARKISQTKAFQRLNMTLYPDPLPSCQHVPFDSDQYWQCMAEHLTQTIYHPVGTCKMGPATDPDAVVDDQLRVYGVSRLRVIDGSIMPTIVNGNTNAPCIMIGEKGAALVVQAWADAPGTPDVKFPSSHQEL